MPAVTGGERGRWRPSGQGRGQYRVVMAADPARRTVPTLAGSGLTGLVLCGGAGRRLGGDKALATVQGRALIDRAVAGLRPVCATVLLAVGNDGQRLSGRADATVVDQPPGAGPLAGVAAGLAVAPTRAVAVCGVDHPDLSPALLAELAGWAAGRDAAVPVVDGWPQPLHAVWTVAARVVVRRCLDDGRRSVHGALQRLDWVAADRDVWARHDPQARFAADVDTPEQLAAAGGHMPAESRP